CSKNTSHPMQQWWRRRPQRETAYMRAHFAADFHQVHTPESLTPEYHSTIWQLSRTAKKRQRGSSGTRLQLSELDAQSLAPVQAPAGTVRNHKQAERVDETHYRLKLPTFSRFRQSARHPWGPSSWP